tara:strand:+ start:296 stop:1723 length:1428 start_codon:yes stop_codon:yes gene_type:complete
MPKSYQFYKHEIRDFIVENLPMGSKILDVGPGVGTYSNLLSSCGYQMDCIEIFEPYIKEYNLKEKYENVIHGNILDLNLKGLDYDFIILGDVLEHINIKDAQSLIEGLTSVGIPCLVAIPYEMEQEESHGNIYETHLQPDLTHPIMIERYPDLVRVIFNKYYGYYVSKEFDKRQDKAYVLHCNKKYFKIASLCAQSIRQHSDIPIFIYLINSNLKVKVKDVTTINWKIPIKDPNKYISKSNGNFYIDRSDNDVYNLLIQKPLIVKDVINKYARAVAYIDSDSVATKYVDNIFNYESDTPMFAEGPFDYLIINGRGGADERSNLSTTLEHPVCELFNIDQYRRLDKRYRNSGYFVVNTNHKSFLDEWYWMCINPIILKEPHYFCPFHEEGTLNPLLWDKHIYTGLPLIYVNVINNKDTIKEVNNINLYGENKEYSDLGDNYVNDNWFKIPGSKDRLLFYHGEKRVNEINKMIKKLK